MYQPIKKLSNWNSSSLLIIYLSYSSSAFTILKPHLTSDGSGKEYVISTTLVFGSYTPSNYPFVNWKGVSYACFKIFNKACTNFTNFQLLQ